MALPSYRLNDPEINDHLFRKIRVKSKETGDYTLTAQDLAECCRKLISGLLPDRYRPGSHSSLDAEEMFAELKRIAAHTANKTPLNNWMTPGRMNRAQVRNWVNNT